MNVRALRSSVLKLRNILHLYSSVSSNIKIPRNVCCFSLLITNLLEAGIFIPLVLLYMVEEDYYSFVIHI
jgi:hypothetical protein